jgi:thioredoxin 1
MSKVPMVSEGEFAAQVENVSGAVVVDFTATWCPPCKMLAPVFERVAEKYDGKVKFYKVDIDENVAVSAKYGVQTIPNLLFFKDGQVVDQSIGFVNETALSAKVDGVLAK